MTIDLDDGAPVCGCGNLGCAEAFVQAAAVARAAGTDDAAEAVERARAGEPRAVEAVAEAGRRLGVAIANVVVVLNPQRVVVGGGLSEAGDLILDPAREELRRRVRVLSVETEVVRAELGYEAGSIGAALWGAEP
jgi:predicted NBD/HSP70 family sugar kinase